MTSKLTFDFDTVTPRMLVDFKRETGVSLMGLVEGGEFDLLKVPEEALAGVIWLAMRMSGRPEATFDEALDTPFSAVELAAPDEAADPTPAG